MGPSAMTKTWFWATNLFFIQQTKDLLLDDKTDLVLGGTSNNEEDSELGGISSIKKNWSWETREWSRRTPSGTSQSEGTGKGPLSKAVHQGAIIS